MKNRIKEIDGVKVLYPYSGAGIFSGFMCLLLAAIPVIMLFFPIYKVNNELLFAATNGVSTVTGLDMFKMAFGFQEDILYNFLSQAGGVYTNIALAYKPCIIAAAVCLCLLGVFAFVEFILMLCLEIGGRLKHYGAPYVLSWWGTVFHLLIMGFPLFLMIDLNQKSGGAITVTNWFSYVYAGGSLLISILLTIAFCAGFNNRLSIKEVERNLKIQKNSTQAVAPIIIQNMMPGVTTSVPQQVSYVKEEVRSTQEAPVEECQVQVIEQPVKVIQDVPQNIKFIGGHAFSQNANLLTAHIPLGVNELGAGAFANCVNLQIVSIPTSVKKIGYNCFFNTPKLTSVNYQGTKKEWRLIIRGSNWLVKSGTNVVNCSDGSIYVNPLH